MTYKGWYAIKSNQPTNQPTLHDLVENSSSKNYQTTVVVQAVPGTHCAWLFHGSGYTDILCISSFQVWYESHTNELAT